MKILSMRATCAAVERDGIYKTACRARRLPRLAADACEQQKRATSIIGPAY